MDEKSSVNFKKLAEEQGKVGQNVILNDGFNSVRTVAAVDQAYFDNKIVSQVVVCDAKTLAVLERTYSVFEPKIHYKVGFIAYREMHGVLQAFEKLRLSPDIILVDGYGIAHPRRLGFASHLGLVLNKPAVGLSDKLLVGKQENDKVYVDKELRAFAVKTKENSRPLYVSPGHLVSLGSAVRIVKNSLRSPHKMPEPLHLARKFAKRLAKKLRDAKQEKLEG